jgi:demethylmenaquinone methyltransferase/2-methoxy-6-polyprenyl-1,4-benzoquinol methylase
MAETPELFDPIAPHYDRWSAVLSLAGIWAWHQAAVAALSVEAGQQVLDVGCGTGRVTRQLAKLAGPSGHVVGLDPSEGMLDEARAESAAHVGPTPDWVRGVGERLPFSDGTFDRVTAQFSVRNMSDWRQGVREMARVLKPGGLLVILDLVQPTTARGALALRGLTAATRLMRLAARRPSDVSSRASYRWLGRSLLHAPTMREVEALLTQTGFRVRQERRWLGDLVALIAAERLPATAAPASAPALPHLVWATDGSLTADACADWLTRYAPTGARVDIVTVCPPLAAGDRSVLAEPDKTAWRRALADAEARLGPRFHVTTHLVEGEPGPALVAFLRQVRPQLVLIGLKRREPAADRLLGSVATYLLAHSEWPVMAVPHPIDPTEATPPEPPSESS